MFRVLNGVFFAKKKIITLEIYICTKKEPLRTSLLSSTKAILTLRHIDSGKDGRLGKRKKKRRGRDQIG